MLNVNIMTNMSIYKQEGAKLRQMLFTLNHQHEVQFSNVQDFASNELIFGTKNVSVYVSACACESL